ncbi:MAG TPA: hypothetical protein VK907_05215 [Phnomibacter sp.]|nr:hypothetical protein [Phnomibacter sp.]
MKITIFFVAIIAFTFSLHAQNGVGIGTPTPHASALLDVSSTTKGMMAPRMTTAQRNAIASPAKGLMVYDTDMNSLFHYNGSAWANLAGGGGGGVFTNTNGTVHNTGNHTTDHFIFGRATMPTNAETLSDSMFYFNKAKGAFRTGGILNNSTWWRPDSTGRFSFAAGNGNKAKGESSMAMGSLNQVSGKSSVALGHAHNIYGDFSTAIGGQNTIWGEAGTAIGSTNVVNHHLGFAVGLLNLTGDWLSMALGESNNAYSRNSLVAGINSRTTGQYSLALGEGLAVRSRGSMVVGRFNDSIVSSSTTSIVTTDPLFMIGNGTDNNNRSNAMTVLKNGRVGIGTTAPTTLLDLNGTIRIRGGNPLVGATLTTSDANGNAVWGRPYAFKAAGSTDGNTITIPNLVWTKVLFNTIALYNVGLGWQPINSQFVALEKGIYHFDATIPWDATSTFVNARIVRSRNGVITSLTRSVYQFSGIKSMVLSTDADLLQNDIVWVEVYRNGNGGIYGEADLLNFSGHMVARN